MSAETPGADPILDRIRFDSSGLVPVVVQDARDGQVLMVAWMDREALRRTLREGVTCFWSRSRREYRVKGATSGNTQRVVRVAVDCDRDTVLVVVEQKGVACHTGKRSTSQPTAWSCPFIAPQSWRGPRSAPQSSASVEHDDGEPRRLPVAGGAPRPRRRLHPERARPRLRERPERQRCRLYLSMMSKMGQRLDRFGDATKPLAEV